MSVRKRHLTIRPNARADIHSILLYTRIHWGMEQRSRYRGKLDVALDSLTRHPDLGHVRTDLMPGIRTLLLERRLISYSVTVTEIVVSRVLHVNQDATGKINS